MKSRALGLFYFVGVCAFAGTISLQPSTATVALGNPFSLSVNVSGVADLYAFQFDIGFDPTVLSAVSVTEGSLFSAVGVFFGPGTIDNTAGTITFIADSIAGPGPGISTDGTLAEILFNTIGKATTNLNLANVILLDSNLGDIAAGIAGSALTVTDVPEPSAYLLLAVGLAVCLGLGRVASPAGSLLPGRNPRSGVVKYRIRLDGNLYCH